MGRDVAIETALCHVLFYRETKEMSLIRLCARVEPEKRCLQAGPFLPRHDENARPASLKRLFNFLNASTSNYLHRNQPRDRQDTLWRCGRTISVVSSIDRLDGGLGPEPSCSRTRVKGLAGWVPWRSIGGADPGTTPDLRCTRPVVVLHYFPNSHISVQKTSIARA